MAFWPSSVATDADLFVVVNALATTLASSITNSVTTIPLTNTTNFPTVGAVLIDQEIIFYTGISGSDLTGCTRGSDGTSIAAHNAGVPVSHTIIAFHHNGLMAEIEAIESWLTTNVVANPLTGNLAAASYKLTGLGAGTTAGDSLRYEQVIGVFLALSGGTMAGNIAMGGSYKLTGLVAGTTNGDSLRYEQVIGQFLLLAGGTMAGNIAMGGSYKLTGLAAGTTNGDSLRYEQVIGQFLSLGGGTLTGVLLIADGSVTAPGLSFASETGSNTGLYWPAQNQLGITCQGILTGFFSRTGCSFLGTTTNDSAVAGDKGEYIESIVGSTANPATGVWGDLTSISLTAGDWDVTAIKYTLVGASMTGVRLGISSTAGDNATGLVVGSNWVDDYKTNVASGVVSLSIPNYRISLTSTTTIYLKNQVVTSGSVFTSYGRLSARRVR